MDEGGVVNTILSAGVTSKTGIISPQELISLASRHPGRIVPAVRTKGREYVRNYGSYYGLLSMQMDMEQFGAMAEVLMYHAQKGGKTRSAPEIVVYPDDKRVVTALDYALDKKWPFIVHIEFAAAGAKRDEFMRQLEDMLTRYPEHPFVLIHMGQLTPATARQMIEAHPNIHFITSHSTPITVSKSRQPWINLFDGYTLSAEWKQLMILYPDRFILGFDMVWHWDWDEIYLPHVKLWRDAFKELPLEVAHAFAHGNAERLWRIQLEK